MQLFQRRRWIHPDRVGEGLDAFVAQLAWIDGHTDLSMAGWRRVDADGEPGAILATTIYGDHGWFLGEVARLQTLVDYPPVNNATAALTVGEDLFERWDAPEGIGHDWVLGDPSFRQATGSTPSPSGQRAWSNAEGADGLLTWFPQHDQPVGGGGHRLEEWARIH